MTPSEKEELAEAISNSIIVEIGKTFVTKDFCAERHGHSVSKNWVIAILVGIAAAFGTLIIQTLFAKGGP